jgi:Skp family chaperone for outer membrane proteins
MEKKLILEELFRMRELMGMNVLSETRYSISRNLLMEGGKTVDELIGLGPKSVDNLTKNGVDFVNDLSKLSDEFTARGIKSFADLSDVVAKKEGIAVADLTDDMIEAYIKNDDVLYKSILAKASAAAADQVDQLIKNVNVSTIFSKNPDQLKSYNVFISTPPSARNIDVLIDGVNDSIDELDKIIDDLNAAGGTVPDELKDLYEQMVSRKTDLTNYKNKGTTPTPSTPYKAPELDPEFKPLFDSDAALESKVLDDLNSFKEQYPDVKGEQLLKIKNDIMNKWKGIPDESTFRSQMDRISSDIENKIKAIQDQINQENNAAKRAELTEELGKTKKKWETAKQVKEFCFGNWSKWKTGSATLKEKGKMVGNALGGFMVCSLAAATLVGEVTSHIKYFAYDNDGQYKNTFMCPIISGLPMLGTYMCENDTQTGEEGWFSKMCPDTCAQERQAQDTSKGGFPNTEKGFVDWVTKNHNGEYGTKYMWQDGKPLYLKDATNNTWDKMTYKDGNFQ